MSDVKEEDLNYDKKIDLSAGDQARQDEWFPHPSSLTPGTVDGSMMEGFIDVDPSIKFVDMPPLESFDSANDAVHYTSPVHSSFLDPGPASEDIKSSPDVPLQAGVVGLRNIGNTCFLNAGLQCLASNSSLVKFFIEDFDLDPSMVNETLSGALADVIRKLWSVQYMVMEPSNFKNVLARYHTQFADYRQHDCQEFLALLLDSLHEQLNCSKIWPTVTKMTSATSSYSPPRLETPTTDMRKPTDENPTPEHPPSSPPLHTTRVETTSQVSPELVDRPSTSVSEDSNQSESSLVSDVTTTSDDTNRRLAPIPESLKRRKASEEDDEPMMCCSKAYHELSQLSHHSEDSEMTEPPDEDGPVNNAINREKRLPSIEDFCMKGTKTLNTNVLASAFIDESVTTDSEKFHKPDNNLTRTSDPFENLPDFLVSEVKGAGAKPFKDTNLLANVRDKFSDDLFTKKCLFSEMEKEESTCSINNIKRMKIDEDEKNIRMQAKLKVNTNKNPTKERAQDLKAVPGSSGYGGGRGGGEPHSVLDRTVLSEEQWKASVLQADKAWAEYKEHNQSVIVNSFQGQFRSTVVCSECHHVSVTYEPFMYLSVPLPHALERQICVVFEPCDSRQPIRYLLTMHKHDNIKRVKEKLLELIKEESCDLIIAEVFDNHVARILEDNMLLKYINETNRTIYAFEMLPPPQIEEMSEDESMPQPSDLPTLNTAATKSGPNNLAVAANNSLSQLTPSQAGQSGLSRHDLNPSPSETQPKTVINNQNNSRPVNNSDNKHLDGPSILNNLGEQGSNNHGCWGEEQSQSSGLEWQDNLMKPKKGGEKECNKANEDSGAEQQGLWKQSSSESDELVMGCDGPGGWGEAGVTDIGQSQEDESMNDGSAAVTTDQWKSCAICLDEMADRDLMVHTACGGTLCQPCLEMSFEHYGEAAFMCPVCSTPVSPSEDFLPMNAMADYKPKTRIIAVPIVQRHDTTREDGQSVVSSFGHPSILYLPSHMTGEFLYQSVDRVVTCLANYSILLTDGQGYHCSRCMYTAHCSGCEISRSAEVTLQPGDHLAVRFTDLTDEQTDSSQKTMDHESMKDKRANKTLTLTDCFKAFMDSEILDEHNPWFCPCCKKNQCAYKTMTVWRYPPILVVYLKRFVFHELTSTKIDNKVEFPLTNLDLSEFISGPKTCNLLFDLHSCLCHFGGVNAGHYTAYAKNPRSKEWYYYNDETCTARTPGHDDHRNTYILFYQLQGREVTFDLPDKKYCDEDVTMSLCSPVSLQPYQHQATLSNEVVSQFLEDLGEHRTDSKTQDDAAQETLDFYS